MINRAKQIIGKSVINPIRTVGKSMSFPKLFSVSLVSLLSMLPLPSLPNMDIMAYAQLEPQQQAQPVESWSEALRTAQSKVEVAMAPAAFGHGVLDLQNRATHNLLIIFE